MDRGGLKHVSNRVYMLFLSMETELRKHLTPSCAHETAGVKGVAIAAVKEDEDVLLEWSMLSGNWGEVAAPHCGPLDCHQRFFFHKCIHGELQARDQKKYSKIERIKEDIKL